MASLAVHSLLLVGLEYGNKIGRGFNVAMAAMTAGVNAPAIVLTPINAVGLTISTTCNNSFVGVLACA